MSVILTKDEFNNKWKNHLETNHYGMAISDLGVIDYVDREFEKFVIQYPNFTYSQIKLKFGRARVYLDNVDDSLHSVSYDLEENINKILNNE